MRVRESKKAWFDGDISHVNQGFRISTPKVQGDITKGGVSTPKCPMCKRILVIAWKVWVHTLDVERLGIRFLSVVVLLLMGSKGMPMVKWLKKVKLNKVTKLKEVDPMKIDSMLFILGKK